LQWKNAFVNVWPVETSCTPRNDFLMQHDRREKGALKAPEQVQPGLGKVEILLSL